METRIAGIFIVSAPLFLIASLFPGSFGGGDAKLMAAAGFLLGWPGALISFVIAAFTCGVYSVLSLVLGKKSRSDAFAFGPHLCVGIFLGMLYVV
jgi:leader peptidase (prepilin peptidase)/N-methyltransferase